ncbi:uncharacterized protein LOC111498680 [Cucurbita maxima]|uniref:Uncharacterized protein LOC111498680 n=1 Tax=Cucurbita maxima TaxID=3661 RepID=A0A6J1KYC8_CUCMA|nr:uncharacterized protein LOC111498680 [Cucurbita maxima]
MASPGRDGGATGGAGSRFPAVDVDRELHPGHNQHVTVDPISSQVAASVEDKEQAKRKATVEEERKQAKKKDTMQTLKTTFIVSGVIAAVAVAAFVVVKKLRQN